MKATCNPSLSSSYHIWLDQTVWQRFPQQSIHCRNTHNHLMVYNPQAYSPEPVHTD